MSSHVGEEETKGPCGVWRCLILKPWKSFFHKTCIYQAVQSACRHVPKASSIATVHPAQILVFPCPQGSKPSRVEFLRWFVRLSGQRSFPWKLFGIGNIFIPLSIGPFQKSESEKIKIRVIKVCNQHKLGVKQCIRSHQLANKGEISTAIWQQHVVLNTAKLLLVVEEIKHQICFSSPDSSGSFTPAANPNTVWNWTQLATV